MALPVLLADLKQIEENRDKLYSGSEAPGGQNFSREH